ncbi:MAG TPA: cobyrinate a,c-diamide synthase [Burkholderiaceae bacterium]|nr:cobyrinate a,c-diamide synthase [Burkholderiaceae bacterium]
MTIPRLLVSAAHRSSGKTTLAFGLAAALREGGCTVQPFKKGPDYIDPMWLSLAAGRTCRNLDPHLSDARALHATLVQACDGADLALVEGNMGLHDGIALDGRNSSAALARALDLPVLLVIDARGMTRGVAPLLLGQQAFDRSVRIGGVVLNRVGGARHEAKLRAAIEHYTDIPVLGALGEDERLGLAERHLGLMPCAEVDDARERVQAIGRCVAAQVDLARVRELAAGAAPLPSMAAPVPAAPRTPDLRIGIARDRAFGFYYPEDLDALRAAGADLVPVDMLGDPHLPALDGLVIGGGFPETCMEALQANAPLRRALREAIEAGLPTYAECGGLMVLARSITWQGRRAEMVGVIPGDAVMHARPVGRGYVELEETGALPWDGPAGTAVHGHEFHHSSLENLPPGLRFAYRVRRGHGIDGQRDGLVLHNLVASYTHLRSGAGAHWAPRFAAFVRRVRAQRQAAAREPALAD